MRQGQQHRRGRNRSNRKGQNPLTRNFESSGPDIKIRGTPAHVAEKYMSLARDALSSGDPVLAENYLQHAEHYNRIILAFREQQGGQSGEASNGRQRSEGYSGGEEAGEESVDEGATEDPARLVKPGDPQPTLSNGEAPRAERGEGRRQTRSRGNGQQREGRGQREPRRRERQRFGESDQQPDFLRRSVRRSRKQEEAGADTEEAQAATESPEVASEQE